MPGRAPRSAPVAGSTSKIPAPPPPTSNLPLGAKTMPSAAGTEASGRRLTIRKLEPSNANVNRLTLGGLKVVYDNSPDTGVAALGALAWGAMGILRTSAPATVSHHRPDRR